LLDRITSVCVRLSSPPRSLPAADVYAQLLPLVESNQSHQGAGAANGSRLAYVLAQGDEAALAACLKQAGEKGCQILRLRGGPLGYRGKLCIKYSTALYTFLLLLCPHQWRPKQVTQLKCTCG
jgi:hypothetical protein